MSESLSGVEALLLLLTDLSQSLEESKSSSEATLTKTSDFHHTKNIFLKKVGKKYLDLELEWHNDHTLARRFDPIIQNVALVVKSTQGYFLNRINNNLVIEGLELKHGLGYLFFREQALFEKVMMQRFFHTLGNTFCTVSSHPRSRCCIIWI